MHLWPAQAVYLVAASGLRKRATITGRKTDMVGMLINSFCLLGSVIAIGAAILIIKAIIDALRK